MSLLCGPATWLPRAAGYTGRHAAEPGSYVLPFPDRRALAGTCSRNGWPMPWTWINGPNGPWCSPCPEVAWPWPNEVAAVLGVPMDVDRDRKIGYPRQPELGVGAIAEGLRQGRVRRQRCSAGWRCRPADLAPVVAAEKAELDRRVRIYRGGARCHRWPDGA